MSQVRLLTSSDIPQAMLLKQTVGWNQTEQDWLRVLELEPEGCSCTRAWEMGRGARPARVRR